MSGAPSCTDIAGALAWARQRVIPSEARLLLRHASRRPAAHLAAWPEETLPAKAWETFRSLVERRAAGEPVAYLMGEREFYGRPFIVNPAVLIPRPETELLVELAIAHFSAVSRLKVLDLGTGSGVLATTLALELDHPEVTALDCSRNALNVAMSNTLRLGASVSLLWSDWYSGLGPVDRFHLIVSNPPYIAEDDPHLVQGDLRFEPLAALASGRNGLRDLSSIVAGAGCRLERNGWLFVEHGYNQSAAVRSLLADAGFADIASWQDLSGIERVSGGRWTS